MRLKNGDVPRRIERTEGLHGHNDHLQSPLSHHVDRNTSLLIDCGDRHEIRARTASAADEHSVDVLDRGQFCCIRTRYGSPIKNAYGRPSFRQELFEIGADESMRFGDVAERGRDAGANSPDWFVGDDDFGGICL
jgi:hypothetical protein